jgi:hypothetical protein
VATLASSDPLMNAWVPDVSEPAAHAAAVPATRSPTTIFFALIRMQRGKRAPTFLR